MISEVIQTLSSDRFSTYLTASGHDVSRALQLYLWNAQMGEAFYMPVQAVEVALRNRVHGALVRRFGDTWWLSPQFLAILHPEGQRDLHIARVRLQARRLPVVTGQMVAGLSFGFWVNSLGPRFNPALWSRELRGAFPALPPDQTRERFQNAARQMLVFRNRISHHEPIFKRDLLGDFSDAMRLLSWICPSTHDWIRPYCRVPALMRLKP